ncbi:MAG: winged helix DNA-binding domain-containing protein [Methanomicrobiales archaeon]|nr:winged helix DNA-binding domain-containing protein [Methanomicrobiales archaeon]
MLTMTGILPEQLRMLRLQAQHLHPRAARGDLVAVAGRLCGINAQQGPAMMLSLRARIRGLEPGDVREAINQRTLVRGWAMRGTLHLLPSRDLLWIVPLVGPAVLARNERRRGELGLTGQKVREGLAVIGILLTASGSLTRRELVDGLVRGAGITKEGQAAYHLLFAAGLSGLVCRGPDAPSGEETFRLTSDWIGRQEPLPREEALEALIRRYLAGYGPAGSEDFVSWSGLPPGDVREGWRRVQEREELAEVRVGDRILWMTGTRQVPEGEPSPPAVSLLPAFDTLVLGYHHREHVVPARYRDRVYHGGQTVPVVLVNGAAAGTWRYDRRGKTLDLSVSPFERFDRVTRELILEDAEDVGRIFGLRPAVSFRT